MIKKVVLSSYALDLLKQGAVVRGNDAETCGKVFITMKDGKLFAVKGALKAFTSVELARERVGNPLNLTEKETTELLANKKITVYRSSGEKDNGKPLTRKEQLEKGVAREITIELVNGSPIIVNDTMGATSYEEIEQYVAY